MLFLRERDQVSRPLKKAGKLTVLYKNPLYGKFYPQLVDVLSEQNKTPTT
jgi:hypothetical protein